MSRFKGMEVLIIEDDDDVIAYLSTWLSDQGFEVLVAQNGAEAMNKVNDHKPDLITLDIIMPQKTGIRFYKEIKNNPRLANTPVIIITGLQREYQENIFQKESLPLPDAYLPKPFARQELLSTIESLLLKND